MELSVGMLWFGSLFFMYVVIVVKEIFKKMFNILKIGTGRKLGLSVFDIIVIFIDIVIVLRLMKSEIIKLLLKFVLGFFDMWI